MVAIDEGLSADRQPAATPVWDYYGVLSDAADECPNEPALLTASSAYTYGEVLHQADRWACALAAGNVGPGDRVALCLGNEPEWVFAFFALCRLRASTVMMSTAWRQREVEHALATTRPVAVIAGQAQAELLAEAGLPPLAVVVGEAAADPRWTPIADLMDADPPELPEHLRYPDPSDLELALPFSSGTTGMPKAVRHTHRSLGIATSQWRRSLGITAEDRLQALTPLAHILGIVNVGATFTGRATIKLFSEFSPRTMVESLERDRITIGMTVAPIAAALAAMPDLEQLDLSSLRYLNWSATPVNEEIASHVTARTGIGWLPAYGTTEVPVIAVNPVDRLEEVRLDSVGLAPEGVEVGVIDLDSGGFLPRGATGELVVRSPAAMKGYLPEGGASPFLDGGWYRTGDIGHVEPDGWVAVTDRLKDLIKVSGFQVSPVEIENVLMTSPLVADCAIFGVADDRRGEVPCAAVVPAEGWAPDAKTLIDWLAPQLSSYKELRAVFFADEIPRTPSGKVLRRRLSLTHPL